MAGLLEQMRRNPQGDWRIKEVESLCREHGLACDPPKGGGSHYKVSHASVPDILTIPVARPIKVVYIRKLLLMVDQVRGE